MENGYTVGSKVYHPSWLQEKYILLAVISRLVLSRGIDELVLYSVLALERLNAIDGRC